MAKPQRLSKVAKEFNVGISTIVDYLAGQGVEVDGGPNTKIEPNVYAVLVDEFQADKASKEKAKEATSVTREIRETVTMEPVVEPTPPKEEKPDQTIRAKVEKDVRVNVVGKIDLAPAEAAKKKEPAAEEAKPAEAAPVAAAPAAPAAAEKAEEKAPEVAKPVAEEAKKEATPEAKPEAKPEVKPAAPAAPAEPKKPARPAEPETIKATAQKLAGPTVVGRIELPKVPDKKKVKPVASSAQTPEDLKRKRKRKRIDNRPDPKGSNQQGARGPGQGTRGPGGRGPGGPGRGPGGPGRGPNRGPNRGPARGGRKPDVSPEEIQSQIKATLARLSGGGKSKSSKHRRDRRQDIRLRAEEQAAQAEMEKSVLQITEFVTVSELGTMMDVSASEVISKLMELEIFAAINQRLDAETISLVAEDFGFSVDFISEDIQDSIAEEEDKPEDMVERAPIITVMGHVDHGKTSLLDHIRRAKVADGEAGGITQHIGAYRVPVEGGRELTFLDTPGHEAFTAMRARGAKVTDLCIIVIAADDSVMPQTKEAISHAQAAGVPMVFAFNKIDKDGANADRIREELSQMNILVEDWGGKYQSQEISAKKGLNIEELLEKVVLETELLELKANPKKRAVGTVLESSLDKGRGYVSNILVEAGTMRVGDVILAGKYTGKVKAMFNERGQSLKEAGPSTPVSILGLNGAPSAGDRFNIMEDEKESKQIATRRQQLQREQSTRTQTRTTLEDIGKRLQQDDFQELNLIIKGDVDGSIEALSDSLQKLSTDEIEVKIIHKAVGQISESDVNLAMASEAVIIGFQVRPSVSARRLAEQEDIDIRLYSIIYKAIEEIRDAMEGMLSPGIEEKVTGTAEIRETFKISKVGTIAGCFITDGKITRNSKVRVLREGRIIHTGLLGSLKRFKDDVKEVSHGYECGLNIDKFNEIKVGDEVEAYEEIEVKKTLDKK